MTTTSSGSLGSGAASTGGASAGSSGAADSGAYGGCEEGQACDGNGLCIFENDRGGESFYCEPQCTTDGDCTDPATTCHVVDAGPETCGINLCPMDATAGEGCDAGSEAPLGGTCIPETFLCVRNGTAASCGDGGTNDNPWVYQVTDQTSDPSQLCPAGDACYNPYRAANGGTCQKLCPFPLDGGAASCEASDFCIVQDARDQTWGFCLPCVSSGSDAECRITHQ